jgi:hypothetical protein
LAAAQEERSRSALNEVRAVKEMDEIDLNNAGKLLAMIRSIEEEHRMQQADTVVPQPAVEESTQK